MQTQRQIAHDIRNCLNSIKLNAEYLALLTPDDVLESMDALSVSIDEMSGLLDTYEAAGGEVIDVKPAVVMETVTIEAVHSSETTAN